MSDIDFTAMPPGPIIIPLRDGILKLRTTLTAETTDCSHWKKTIDLLLSQPDISPRLDQGYLGFTKVGRKLQLNAIQKLIILLAGIQNQDVYLRALYAMSEHRWILQGQNLAPITIMEHLPNIIVDTMLPFLRRAPTSDGSPIWFVKTSLNQLTWGAVKNWIGGLELQIDPESGQTFLKILSDRINHLQLTGQTNWGCSEEKNPQTGVIEEVRVTKFAEAIQRDLELLNVDDRFYMKYPQVFTNDPTVNAFSFFPLNDLDSRCTGSCEHWLDFESQIPEWGREAFRASFYATFDASNRSRQIVILVDSGQTGKSNMFRAIASVVDNDNFYVPISKDAFINNFWGAKIYGRRLIMFSDSGNTRITQMDKLKQISGGDPINIEFKGVSGSIPYIPNSRVWVSTNSIPDINASAKNQLSRSLVFPLTATKDPRILKKFCQVDEYGELVLRADGSPIIVGASYDTLMKPEFFDYLRLCKASYIKLCPTGQDVIVPPEMLEYIRSSCASEQNDAHSFLIESYVELNAEGTISSENLHIIVAEVAEEHEVDATYKHICNQLISLGCSRCRVRVDNKQVRGFKGLQLRENIKIVRGTICMNSENDTLKEDLD